VTKFAIFTTDFYPNGGLCSLSLSFAEALLHNTNILPDIISFESSPIPSTEDRKSQSCIIRTNISTKFGDINVIRYFSRPWLKVYKLIHTPELLPILREYSFIQLVLGSPAFSVPVIQSRICCSHQLATLQILEGPSKSACSSSLLISLLRSLDLFLLSICDILTLPFLKHCLVENKRMYNLLNCLSRALVYILYPPAKQNYIKEGAQRLRMRHAICNLERPIRLISVGRLYDKRKNISFLIKAALEVARIKPDRLIELKLAGSSSLNSLLRYLERSSIPDNFIISLYQCPSDARLLSIYLESDIYCISSLEEGFCIAGLDALALGLPVVSTPCVGPQAYIRQGRTGYYLNSFNHRKYALAICSLLRSNEVYWQASLRSQLLAQRRFKFSRFSADLNRLHSKILSAKRK
jgi:glycosyltransferase involved in cell wall biosynthesis